MYCKNCGSEIDDNAQFCKYCGTKVQDVVTVNNQKPAEDKPIKGGILGFVLTFFIGFIGFIVCLIFGDEACRKTAIITFVATIVVGIVTAIIYLLFIGVLILSIA